MNRDGHEYLYLGCEDWFIYSIRDDGYLCMLSTETSEYWWDLHEGADSEPDAVEKYMLPKYKEKWDIISWDRLWWLRTPEGCVENISIELSQIRSCSTCGISHCFLANAHRNEEGKINIVGG